jgi:hypothetical protein
MAHRYFTQKSPLECKQDGWRDHGGVVWLCASACHGDIFFPWPQFLLVLRFLQTATYAIHDLCLYPQFVDALRAELDTTSNIYSFIHSEELPFLDSFIKESARVTSSDASKRPPSIGFHVAMPTS